MRRHKWSTSPTTPGMRALSIGVLSASRWAASRVAVLTRLCSRSRRMFAFLCYHLQIPVRHAHAGVGPGIASHNDLGVAGGGHHDPSDDPSFMQRFVSLVDNEHRKGHFPDIWDPNKPQKPCLLSPNGGSTSSAVASTARPLPDVRTISGLQQALKMLGYRIAVDGDYGPETRQVVTNFQMHAGIVADGIAGAQTEAKLLSELSSVRQTNTHRANPV
jgi:Putative peptidoglycan binding domain